MNKMKKILTMLLIIPVMLLCSCNKFKPECSEIPSLSYYYKDSVDCEIFNLPQKTLTIADLQNEKVQKHLLDSYAQITLTANSAEAYHLYIEYIYFKVYTNLDSEYAMNVDINITNVISEENIGKSDLSDEDKNYKNTYACQARKESTAVFKVYVGRTIATATGSKITIDILSSEIYATDEKTNFRWLIYDFKIYGESRAY